jgi:predicted ATPase
LLDYLTRRLRSARILVLGTYRREELNRRHPLLPMIQDWGRSSSVTVIDLEPLSPDRVAEMVRAIFDIQEVKAATRDFLHTRTEGNPFVLEEMLKVRRMATWWPPRITVSLPSRTSLTRPSTESPRA